MNYFVRAMWVILIGFSIVAVPKIPKGWKSLDELIVADNKTVAIIGVCLAFSLLILHVLFH